MKSAKPPGSAMAANVIRKISKTGGAIDIRKYSSTQPQANTSTTRRFVRRKKVSLHIAPGWFLTIKFDNQKIKIQPFQNKIQKTTFRAPTRLNHLLTKTQPTSKDFIPILNHIRSRGVLVQVPTLEFTGFTIRGALLRHEHLKPVCYQKSPDKIFKFSNRLKAVLFLEHSNSKRFMSHFKFGFGSLERIGGGFGGDGSVVDRHDGVGARRGSTR